MLGEHKSKVEAKPESEAQNNESEQQVIGQVEEPEIEMEDEYDSEESSSECELILDDDINEPS